MEDQQHRIPMKMGGEIVLHRLIGKERHGLPVVVAHGTLSNADAVRNLAEYLGHLGFDCWLLEWGGHGQSKPARKRQNFEYPAFHDAPLAIEYVLSQTRQEKLFWVSHSGGGHLPLMHLSRHPEEQRKLAGIATLGTQATDAAIGLKYQLSTRYLGLVSNTLGCVPRKLLPIAAVEGEPTNLLGQWATWNLARRWMGDDGFDYMSNLSLLNTPFFMIAGGDDEIAPASGCKKIFDHMNSEDKSWLECSVSNGFSKNYAHGQLVRGSAAQSEIFPRIGEWLSERSPS